MANNMLRMSGMNSGLDTESIINALTANSKLKITKQERSLLKYKAVQEGYRDVISKLQNIKSSYFDVLKKNSNLSGTSMWNKFAAKTSVNGVEQNVAGVSISTTLNSQPGEYSITVDKTASQANIQGKSLSNNAFIDASQAEEGTEYGMTVTVGDVQKNITFKGGATASLTRRNINLALIDAFGESNDSINNVKERGMVYVDGSGKFVSKAGKGISISGMGGMDTAAALNMAAVETGKNTLSFQVGDETASVTFQTLASDYFDDIFDDEGNVKDDADEEKAALYEQVKDDYVESKKYEAYKAWSELATDEDKAALKAKAFEAAEEKQRVKYVDKFLEKEYDTYKSGLAEGEEADSFDDWKAANFVDVKAEYDNYKNGLADPASAQSFDDYKAANGNELYSKFEDYYYDHPITPSAEQEAQYNFAVDGATAHHYGVYRAKALSEGAAEEDLLDMNTWKDRALDENDDLYSEEYKGLIDSYHDKYYNYTGYTLDENSWEAISYNEYSAYKDELCTVTEENIGFDKDDIIKHYNDTSLRNSIGSLETKNSVKFDIDIENGYAISATNAEGEEVKFSMTAAQGSTNAFGAETATVSVSQISNSTKLSDLNIDADEDGKFSFKINGKSFSFDADTTVKDMMKTINASDAGVKIAYSSLENSFTLTSNEYGTGSKVEITDDSQNLFSALGLKEGAKYNKGENLVVTINGKTYESDGNSIEADGTTFTFTAAAQGAEFTTTIGKDTSAIADVIKGFVEEYNKAIKEIYEYLDEKPDKDYYFLADADKEQLNLSEKQEEKWEEKAKKGILYHDNTISSAMTKLRTALMGSITDSNGNAFSLSSIGIKTATDYKEHGKLVIDEDELMAAIENHSEDIAKLFSGEDGIMKKFSEALDAAVGTTGKNKGTLILKAGLATGSTATDNQLYTTMKNISKKITTLTRRYENEQDRLWKKYSAMESMLGTMNSQSASISSFFQQ